jgi:GDPmannose 4,6-dehydratase
MHLMLNHSEPLDLVVATGVLHTVRDFCEIAFAHAGLDWKKYVVTNPRFFRDEDAIPLQGNPAAIQQALNWQPTKSFEEIVCEMVDHDCAVENR